jgi:inosine-uridine nucleoside N-ribohydrolase
MRFLELLSVTFFLGRSISTSTLSKRNNTARYAILDNDWGSTSFIPILLGVDAGINILGVASCMSLYHMLVYSLAETGYLATGDSWQRQGAYHALAALEIGNLSCIPVVYGATYPLINTVARMHTWEALNGPLVYQGVFAPYNATAEALGADPTSGTDPNRIEKAAFVEGFPNTTTLPDEVAAKFMVEQVRKYPGQVSIFAAGGLTNVALAVRMDEDFASLAKELVVMGGYVDVNMNQVSVPPPNLRCQRLE